MRNREKSGKVGKLLSCSLSRFSESWEKIKGWYALVSYRLHVSAWDRDRGRRNESGTLSDKGIWLWQHPCLLSACQTLYQTGEPKVKRGVWDSTGLRKDCKSGKVAGRISRTGKSVCGLCNRTVVQGRHTGSRGHGKSSVPPETCRRCQKQLCTVSAWENISGRGH